jgi:RNA-directed DNA polymerase
MEPLEGTMKETLSSPNISTRLERIASLARETPERAFTTLAHHIDIDLLKEAYRRTRKDGAVGVDGQSAAAYATHLEENLQSLLDRAKSGSYRAPNVRRVHIPKGDGSATRPLGIPTFEDKVLQRAVLMVLEPIYEQDFLACSYGFRPRRSAHDALHALYEQATKMCGGWILEIDIEKFFDRLDHGHLREILRRRVRDGVLLRLIGKWLNAGVLEHGAVSYPEAGTPQGGVISPLLANIYLHEVLDVWFEGVVKPRIGKAGLYRYADDAVMLFASEADARRVMAVLPKRLGKYGLTLHPQKTRLVEFRRPDRRPPAAGPGPGTFDFLGFTQLWLKSHKGRWILRQQTAKDRLRRAMRAISTWCRRWRHLPMKQQHRALVRKLHGHYAYFGVIGNWRAMKSYWHQVKAIWFKWLNRRSNRSFPWDEMHTRLKRFVLPSPRITSRAANP